MNFYFSSSSFRQQQQYRETFLTESLNFKFFPEFEIHRLCLRKHNHWGNNKVTLWFCLDIFFCSVLLLLLLLFLVYRFTCLTEIVICIKQCLVVCQKLDQLKIKTLWIINMKWRWVWVQRNFIQNFSSLTPQMPHCHSRERERVLAIPIKYLIRLVRGCWFLFLLFKFLSSPQ